MYELSDEAGGGHVLNPYTEKLYGDAARQSWWVPGRDYMPPPRIFIRMFGNFGRGSSILLGCNVRMFGNFGRGRFILLGCNVRMFWNLGRGGLILLGCNVRMFGSFLSTRLILLGCDIRMFGKFLSTCPILIGHSTHQTHLEEGLKPRESLTFLRLQKIKSYFLKYIL